MSDEKKGTHFQVTINLKSLQTFQVNTYLNVTVYILVSFFTAWLSVLFSFADTKVKPSHACETES